LHISHTSISTVFWAVLWYFVDLRVCVKALHSCEMSGNIHQGVTSRQTWI